MSLKGEDLFEALEDVEEGRISHSERKAKGRKQRLWIKWGGLAACACLIILAVTTLSILLPEQADDTRQESKIADDRVSGWQDSAGADTAPKEDIIYGFSLNGYIYVPLGEEEAERYGLAPISDREENSSVGMESAEAAKEEIYDAAQNSETEKEASAGSSPWQQAEKEDLGEFMGIIEECAYETLNGCRIYHYAAWPEDDGICIVEHDGEYEFYCKSLIESE